LVDLEDLQPAGFWKDRSGDQIISVSDTGLLLGTSGAGALLGARDGPWRVLCSHYDPNWFSYIPPGGTFVNDITIFWLAYQRQGVSIRLSMTDGSIGLDERLARHEITNPSYVPVGGGRFAIAIYKGRGGSEILDIGPHYSLKCIKVYDLSTRRWVYTLDGKRHGIRSISGLALSPDGASLGVINQDGMLQVYRVPGNASSPPSAQR
jgi:WD40 repeat protein